MQIHDINLVNLIVGNYPYFHQPLVALFRILIRYV